METWTQPSKPSDAVFTALTKHSAVFATRIRAGSPWFYDQVDITYNDLEVDNESPIYYETQGSSSAWTNLTKN